MNVFKSALLALLILLPVAAQANINTDPAAQPAGAYEGDTSHTSVHWRISHLGLSNYTARFDKIETKLDFNPQDATQSKVTVSIDPASVSTGLENFDKKLTGEGYFNVAKNPRITFTSTKIEKTGERTGNIIGDLTLNGVTKPVTLTTTFNGGMFNQYAGGHSLGFSATTKIKRSDFGMTTLLPAVGDEVEIIIEAEFVQKTQENKQ